MYSILIADDDPRIREGLFTLIDWRCLGFEVAKVCADGREVLEYLARAEADVVLTDIRMPGLSGIELAQAVFERGLPAKVVFISGYKEADYALSAVRYHVRDYIVKPIDVRQLLATMERVKRELDEEAERVRILDHLQAHIGPVKDAFWENALFGAYASAGERTYTERVFRLLYPGLSAERVVCFTAFVELNNLKDFLDHRWEHAKCDFFENLANFVRCFRADAVLCLLDQTGERLTLVGALLHADAIEAEARLLPEAFCREMEAVYGLQAELKSVNVYVGLPALMELRGALPSKEESAFRERERPKLLYTALLDGDSREAQNVLDAFLHPLRAMQPTEAREALVAFFRAIMRMFKGTPGMTELWLSFLREVRETDSGDALAQVARETLARLNALTGKADVCVIDRIKEYLTEHMAEDISLEDISRVFFLNQCYISRLFRAKAGETLTSFMTRIRMEQAARLLAEPEVLVSDVCELVGYQTSSYFIKLFRRQYGVTPAEYRKALRGGSES